MPRRTAFTLIELLVVIAIIAVLVGITIPVLSKVRRTAARTQCAAQLRDIASAFQTYLNDSKGRLPGLNPLPLAQPAFNNAPLLYEVFDQYTKNNRKIWVCPADAILTENRPTNIVADAETYAQAYGVSYEYNFWMNQFYGTGAFRDGRMHPPNAPFREALNDALKGPRKIPQERFRIFNDFTYFHGKKGTQGNMNFLFADWHVSDLEGGSSDRVFSATGTR